MANIINLFGKQTTERTPSEKKTKEQSRFDYIESQRRRYNEEHHTRLSYGQYQAKLYYDAQRKKK